MALQFDDLQELLWNFASHRVITVAGRAGILTRMAEDSGYTPDELAKTLELDPLATGKVVRALAALGLLESTGDGGYHMVSPLAPHFAAGPDALTPFLEHSHMMYERWGESLESWLRGEPWTTQRRGPPDSRKFGAAMQAMGSQVARMVADHLDLTGVRRMLDVGGGFGHYARAICRKDPQIKAAVLDKPEVVELARKEAAGTEWEGRLEFIGGDYLEADYGEGYDLVLCANILHQESATRAAQLVRRGADALVPGGRVVVLDFSIDDEQHDHVVGALFAINMRSFGDTYPAPTIKAWMESAGLTDVERSDFNRHRWLITGRRPR